jgi:NodT family efflux transporter outer membrane factor (OMF) lipoprotein
MNRCIHPLLALLATVLAGCAVAPAPPALPKIADVPAAWQAPLPVDADSGVPDDRRWWQQFDDPLVAQLVEAAQAASPDIAAARARIVEARASRTAAGAALLPSVDLGAMAMRGNANFALPTNTTALAGLQTSWELDLFGADRAARDLADARLAMARDRLRGARAAVAAEVATSYATLRACQAQRVQAEIDSRSRAETERLATLAVKAGFQSSADLALVRATAAQGRAIVTQRGAACDLLVKSLVELTASDEEGLRDRLAAATARLPQPAHLAVARVPAVALAQRPDLAAAAHALLAAQYDVAQNEAARYPRIALSGSIAAARFESSLQRLSTNLWSIGPQTVSLPIFDGGTRLANVDAARARADEAAAAYRARLRAAVREVEAALVALQSAADRETDATTARDGYAATLQATDDRYRRGMASLFDLEQARRLATQAESALIELRSERVTAWIDLYRALGGGWPDDDAATSPSPSMEPAR